MRNRILLFTTLLAAVPACVAVSTPPGTQPEASASAASSASPGSTPLPVEPTPPPVASTPPASSSRGQGPGDVALFGTWKSATCGARKYERLITFTKDNTFTAEDRVSPCPPNVKCIWSGIVSRQGSYKRDGITLLLNADGDPKGPGAQPFPTSLSVDAATGAPAEAGTGGKACVYQR